MFEDVKAKVAPFSVLTMDSVKAEKAWRENDIAEGKDVTGSEPEISYEKGYGILFHSRNPFKEDSVRDGATIVLGVQIRGSDTPGLAMHAMRDMECSPNIQR